MRLADASRNIESILRLTPTQEGLLFHALYAPEKGLYFEQYTCVLSGELDVASLEKAWAAVVQRYDAVRALFTWERRKEPLQLIRARVDVPFSFHDWSGERSQSSDALESYLERDRARGFDLDVAPLMRVALMRLDDRRHRLIWSFHHLILDGWSQRVFLHEVLRAYEAFVRGHDPTPAPTAPSFGSYVSWRQSQDHDAASHYWREKLEGLEATTRLNMPRPPAGEHLGHGEVPFALSKRVTQALEALARSERVTLNVVVRAVWAILLHRYIGVNDLMFGATVSGRSPELAGVESSVGLFINTLPVRTTVEPAMEARALLRSLYDDQIASSPYEFSSLAEIARATHLPTGRPLFETIVVFENHPAQASSDEAPSLEVLEPRYVERSNFPLALLAVPGERLELILVFDRTRHTPAAVERLASHFEILAAAIAENPSARIDTLTLLGEGERHRLVAELSVSSKLDLPSDTVLHRFDRLARDEPDRVAAIGASSEISYGDLRERARGLATKLLAAGVQRNDIVAIGATRSIEMLTGVLGAFYAGCAYVPVDPEWPSERKAFVLEDTGARAIATTQSLAGDFTKTPPVCLIDPADELDSRANVELPELELDPEQRAYVLYTSGSSGSPKGVEVTHRNLWHSTAARFEVYEEPVHRFLLLSAFTFDSSVAGLFWSLTTGGALVLPPKRVEQDVEGLTDWIERAGVTHTLCLPSLYQLILEHADLSRLGSLRTVIVAGESCPRALAPLHAEQLPQASLYNEYGPTEATVWSVVHRVNADEPGASVPIGRPIPGASAFILDSSKEPVPIGMIGELHIGGPCVAKGYLNRPTLSSERFIDVELEPGAPSRLYRTGDLARFREDGVIEFLGRYDDQVKVRGYRIELEEIEAAINEQPGVRQSAVVLTSPVASEVDERAPDGLAERLTRLGEVSARRLVEDILASDSPVDEAAL